MHVLRFNNSPDSPALINQSIPVPQPGPGEVLIRVHAVGVTPTELLWYPTTHTRDGGVRTGAIPGHEFSGVIDAAGTDIDPREIGRHVYGMNDWFAEGATAEYCLSTLSSLANKPSRLTHPEAASVPIGALTAWQGLFDRARLRTGERVLIHGGSGAVGVFAIQFARRTGAYVITTASARNFDFLSRLGAHQTIDYHADHFEDHAGKVDVVFDAVGGETLRRSWSLLKPSGRMVTIAATSEGTKDDRIEKAFFIVEPNRNQLDEISHLFEIGEIEAFVDTVVPFSKASDAYCGRIENRSGRGKMVVSIL